MRTALTALELWYLVASGRATAYAPGVMEQVIENRSGWDDLPAWGGDYVAVEDCSLVGYHVWLEVDGNRFGPYLVADCAAEADREYLSEIGFAVDLSAPLAEKLGLPLDDVRVWALNEEPLLQRAW